MAERSIEEIQKIIKKLKHLDWTERDVSEVFNIKTEEIRKLVKDYNL